VLDICFCSASISVVQGPALAAAAASTMPAAVPTTSNDLIMAILLDHRRNCRAFPKPPPRA
jgi:hypothetical protein